MTLEIISRTPAAELARPPLLFVHGAWHGAWCWDEHFLPYFAGLGYACHAVSLRAHGASPGRLRWSSLNDYVRDVAEAVATLGAKPIVIGHSMGGAVVQRYLQRHDAVAGVLVASVPPLGVIGATVSIAMHHPLRFLWANLTMSLYGLVNTPALARELFFSDSMPDAELGKHANRLGDESYRAFLDMLRPNPDGPRKVKTPLLVIGAENDRIFPPPVVRATAKAYRTEAKILPDMAHDMMLDTRWRDAADTIAAWIERRS